MGFHTEYLGDPANSYDIEMNVDGSVTPVNFETAARAKGGGTFNIHRFLLFIQDANCQQATYGGLAGLTNGVRLLVLNPDGSTRQDLTLQHPITSNGEWRALCFDSDVDRDGAGNDAVRVRWTFTKGGTGIAIGPGEVLRFIVQDNLTGLTVHHAVVQGNIHPRETTTPA